MRNNSPWIHQLDHEREIKKLEKDGSADVAVIGAGIAGISTAFYLLKHTEKSVAVIEGYKLAHGATGHNAGQLVTYFERPFSALVDEFGLELAVLGQKDINSAWDLLDEIYKEAGLNIPLARFTGYAGYSTKEQVLNHLENAYLRRSGGLYVEPIGIAEDAPFLAELPEKYKKLITLLPREEIALKLETFDTQYLAIGSTEKGVMNSALFCQEVVNYLLEKYPKRFSLYEHTSVGKVVVHDEKVILDGGEHTFECKSIVLCTNGFDNFEIFTPSGLSVDSRFHHSISGVVGFMSGYLEKHTGAPAALSYFQKEDSGITDNPGEPYFYITRRSYESELPPGKHDLVSVGGPDYLLEDTKTYKRDLEFSAKAREQIEKFLKRAYDKNKKDLPAGQGQAGLDQIFLWHGVMGYTKNMVRMIGPDPSSPRLYYNLGCNGVGLLPSIFGGFKVARQLAGVLFPPSIFDVPASPLVLEELRQSFPKAQSSSPARI